MPRKLKPAEEPRKDVHALDRLLQSWLGRFTRGFSPAALALAHADWALHLSMRPGKQFELAQQGVSNGSRLFNYGLCSVFAPAAPTCVEPSPDDDRFGAPQWHRWPFDLLHQSFLLNQQWWQEATTGVRGVDPHHQDVVSFMARQVLDMFSPSNFFFTNPEVLELTAEEQGRNLLRGWRNYLDDVRRLLRNAPPAGVEEFQVGRNLALTPGKVVYRNGLIELIQYLPKTPRQHPEPVLFIPAWIMKYYILDLRPGKSMVEYLLEQGHSVFVVSWKNPTAADRELGMDDYRRLGVMAALDAVSAIAVGRKIHMAGYCLGGTLSLIAAATMARDGDLRLASLTLLAAQADFTEPGELDLFIDDSQEAFLEDYMWQRGYLDAYQMARAFQLLRSQDLIWSRMIREYLSGERAPMIDLMAWNADATRLPYRMHSEYLRELFLNNDLAEGRYDVEGQPIHLGDIRVPIFAVGTLTDHVAPWESAYKIRRLARTEVSFLLTTGGHNTGIVTPPEHPRRRFQLQTRQLRDRHMSPEQFLEETPQQQGSWWPAWEAWLTERSSRPAAPATLGAPDRGLTVLADAPGEYVLQK